MNLTQACELLGQVPTGPKGPFSRERGKRLPVALSKDGGRRRVSALGQRRDALPKYGRLRARPFGFLLLA